MAHLIDYSWRYAGWLVMLICWWPLAVQAEWLTQVRDMEKALSPYNAKTLIAMQSEALWYYAWQVDGVDFSNFLQRLQEHVEPFDLVFIQKNEMAWEQSRVEDPCSLRISTVGMSSVFVSLGCMRSQQPVHQPLLRHPALQLLWAWDEKLSEVMVEHQWYSVQEGIQPKALLLAVLHERFPSMPIAADQYALSFEKDAEQWLLTWVQLGKQAGVYVLRWR